MMMGLTMVGLVFAIISIFIHGVIAGTIALFIVAYFFRSMTIEISDTELTWYFGSGFPRKRVALERGRFCGSDSDVLPERLGNSLHARAGGFTTCRDTARCVSRCGMGNGFVWEAMSRRCWRGNW